MSKSQLPPVPPAGRSNKGPAASPNAGNKSDVAAAEHHPEQRNLAEQGRQGNIKQNTTNQGYQQDR
jgi:hypothetical protein